MRAVIHHLNCGSLCPRAADELVCHVLLVEGAEGLTLVDTGLGTRDVERPKALGPVFTYGVRPALRMEETAVAQVRALGFDPADVRDVVVTHLDGDHAGGLPDFPHARVHVFRAEHEALLHPRLLEKPRFVRHQFAHGPDWVVHDVDGDDWNGFEAVRVLGDDVLLVPLPGHTRGHSGVAVRDGDGWLLHCGDLYMHRGEARSPAQTPKAFAAYEWLLGLDDRKRRANMERVRELARTRDDVRAFCSHDAHELAAFAVAAPARSG